jgi:hypothetical protein
VGEPACLFQEGLAWQQGGLQNARLWHGMAWHAVARHGMAWHAVARHGKAVARHGIRSQDAPIKSMPCQGVPALTSGAPNWWRASSTRRTGSLLRPIRVVSLPSLQVPAAQAAPQHRPPSAEEATAAGGEAPYRPCLSRCCTEVMAAAHRHKAAASPCFSYCEGRTLPATPRPPSPEAPIAATAAGQLASIWALHLIPKCLRSTAVQASVRSVFAGVPQRMQGTACRTQNKERCLYKGTLPRPQAAHLRRPRRSRGWSWGQACAARRARRCPAPAPPQAAHAPAAPPGASRREQQQQQQDHLGSGSRRNSSGGVAWAAKAARSTAAQDHNSRPPAQRTQQQEQQQHTLVQIWGTTRCANGQLVNL